MYRLRVYKVQNTALQLLCLQMQTLLLTQKFRQNVWNDAQTSENVQKLDLLPKNTLITMYDFTILSQCYRFLPYTI